jgi:hypothetical protein
MRIAGAIVLTVTVGARADMLDDFNDGNDDGWTRFALAAPGAMWDASTGVYGLSAPEVPPGGTIGSLLDITADPFFSNGFWSAIVARETDNSRSDLAMRGDFENLNAYMFGWAPAFGLVIGRVDGGITTVLANEPGFVQDVGVEYILEAGAIGSDLELRMWLVGDERPDLPQVTATDSTYVSGMNGLLAVSRPDLPGDVSSTFDDVSFEADPCPADLDGSGAVDATDLAQLLGNWGECPDCPGDLNGDDVVDAADLAQLLGSWGPCP